MATEAFMACIWCDYEGKFPEEVTFGPMPDGEIGPQCVDTDACDERQQINAEREESERQSVIKSQRSSDSEERMTDGR